MYPYHYYHILILFLSNCVFNQGHQIKENVMGKICKLLCVERAGWMVIWEISSEEATWETIADVKTILELLLRKYVVWIELADSRV